MKTNTLWATHFHHQNDDFEVATLKLQLQKRMSAYHAGGAAPMARDLVKSLYASTFERDDPQFAIDALDQSHFTFGCFQRPMQAALPSPDSQMRATYFF